MKVVLPCWSSHDDTCGCDYALVDLTPDLARLVLDRVRVFRKLSASDAGLCDLRWWNCDAVFFSPWGSGDDPDGAQPGEVETQRVEQYLSGLDGGREVLEVSDDLALDEEMIARTECDRMVVCDDGVSFSCIPKHTDVRISTGTIPVEMLERVASADGTGVHRRKQARRRAA
jgi:hypothetical protein